MIRALILWFVRRLLSKYLGAAVAGQIAEAAGQLYDRIRENGGDAIVVRPADPGAKPVTLDDILKSENQPNV